MKKLKQGGAEGVPEEAGLEMQAINAFAKTELSAQEVYTFSVLLCDNEVDRDFERFGEKTLEELRELFVGATGISDHEWRSGGQKARIYRTELVRQEGRKNSLGMPYMFLKGYAYMLRSAENEALIAEIEAGIKRETSVGCSVAKSLCSICGEEIGSTDCAHTPGREYAGRLCYAELTGAVDAYEWSFVAVPAQRGAGVMKRYGGEGASLLKLVSGRGGAKYLEEYEALKKSAGLGERYIKGLRREVLRLGLLCDRELHRALVTASERMDEGELLALKSSLEMRVNEKFPPETQLPGRGETVRFDGGEYIV